MKTVQFERSAAMSWEGDVARGSGVVRAGSGSFVVQATYPSLRGESSGATTPEELLAASHAVCYAIALRSVLARSRASAARIIVTATITAQKGEGAIRITRSQLSTVVEDVAGLDAAALAECATAAKEECTISNSLRGNVEITCDVVSAAGANLSSLK